MLLCIIFAALHQIQIGTIKLHIKRNDRVSHTAFSIKTKLIEH